MTNIILGLILVALADVFINRPLLSLLVFTLLAVPVQLFYAKKLNNCLEGEDPAAKYHVKNLKELRTQIRIPIYIIIIEKIPKIFGIAAFVTLLIAVGILK
tara:strand:+ start:160 stop:462 length:303 start_codon:yes stop_codon:yes gene_type:complete